MTKSQTLKNIIKKNVGEKPTFGTDPKDPWSAKANINETALLNRYLKSRGINPEFATKDQKVAHSKTNQFKSWMRNHMNDPVRESVDKKDTITFDIPLLIRVLEFAREDLKNDVNLHKMVERLISMRGKGTLTMNQYGRIIKEEVESDRLDEISGELQHRYFKAAYAQKNDKTVPKDVRKKRSTGMNKVINRTLRRNRLDTPGAAQDFKDQEAKRGIGHVRDHVEVEGQMVENRVVDAVKKAWKAVGDFDSMQPKYDGNTRRRQALKKKLSDNKKKVSEAKEANYGGDYQASVLAVKAKAEKKPVDMKSLAARMQASYAKDKLKKESMDPQAACSCPGDGANSPDDVAPKGKKLIQMSKAAKIKSIVKEELYDKEKDDKPSASIKSPKVKKPGVDGLTGERPQAAAIMQGGTTLTGAPRDTIEIDPMMKIKKPQKSFK